MKGCAEIVFSLFGSKEERKHRKVEREEKRESKKKARLEKRAAEEAKKEAEEKKKRVEAEAKRKAYLRKKLENLDILLGMKPFSNHNIVAFRVAGFEEITGKSVSGNIEKNHDIELEEIKKYEIKLVETISDKGEHFCIYNNSNSGNFSECLYVPIKLADAVRCLGLIMPRFKAWFDSDRFSMYKVEYENKVLSESTTKALISDSDIEELSQVARDYAIKVGDFWNADTSICQTLKVSKTDKDFCAEKMRAEGFFSPAEDRETDESTRETSGAVEGETDAAGSGSAECQDGSEEENTILAKARELLGDITNIKPFNAPRQFVGYKVVDLDIQDWKKHCNIIVVYEIDGVRWHEYVLYDADTEKAIFAQNLPKMLIMLNQAQVINAGSLEFIPDGLSTFEHTLSLIMPRIEGYSMPTTVYGDKIYGGVNGARQPTYVDCSNLLSVDELERANADIFDLFFSVKENWTMAVRQKLGISYDVCKSVIENYKKYEDCQRRHRELFAEAEDEGAAIQEAGKRGEADVDYQLKWIADPKRIIKDNTTNQSGNRCIKLKNIDFIDEAQEFDHILVRENGVFIIETKNLSGNITISKSGNWTRIKKGGVEEAVVNPSSQLDRHETLIKSFLGKDVPVCSIVCIANDRAMLKGEENAGFHVCKSDLLSRFIVNYEPIRKLSLEEIEQIETMIEDHYSD